MVEYVTTGQPMTWWQYLKNVNPQRVSSFISNNLEMHEFLFLFRLSLCDSPRC